MIKKRASRGASHIEMILSLVLFIALVGVALFFFRPSNTSRLVDTSLDYTFSAIEKNSSVEITTYSISLNDIAIRNKEIISFYIGNPDNKKERIVDKRDNVLQSGSLGEIVSVAHEGNNFIYVSLSKGFPGGNLDVGAVSQDDYEISSSLSKKVISEKAVRKLGEEYSSNYEELKKEEFNLPSRNDFGILLTFTNKSSIIIQREVPSGADVFSRTKKIEILKEDGLIELGELTVKIW